MACGDRFRMAHVVRRIDSQADVWRGRDGRDSDAEREHDQQAEDDDVLV